MKFGTYLKNHQPLLYQTFSNALATGRTPHSVLVEGEIGTPLKETALYLAKSLLCDHPEPLACEECTTCVRVLSEEYPDLVVFDGEESSIKKGDVESVVTFFQQTPLETKGIMIYVIHLAENMTAEAANALLKFLEEPAPHAFAILTTQNKEKLLPTIVSRCETMRLFLLPREEAYQEAISLGVNEEDAELLSYVVNDGPTIAKKVQDPVYQNAKEAFLLTVEALGESPKRVRFALQKEVGKLLNDKPTVRYYFDFLAVAYKEIIGLRRGSAPLLPHYAKMFAEVEPEVRHPESSLLSLMTLRREAETPINTVLLLTHLASVLTKENPHGR